MFKRFRWISMGAAVGFGGSVWAQRRVRRTVERYLPERMGADMTQRARYLADDVRAALDEGREAMQEREEELRRQMGVVGSGRPDGRRHLPSGEPGRHRARRRPGAAPVIDVAEGRLDGGTEPVPLRRPDWGDGGAEPAPPRRRGPRRRRPGE